MAALRGELRKPRFHESRSFQGIPVQISEDTRRSVVFIGVEDDSPESAGIRCIGTGFLLGYDQCLYLVTSKHNILPLAGAPYMIRVNRIDGTADNFIVEDDQSLRWFQHRDRNVDLAVAPFGFDLKTIGSDVTYITGIENLSSDHGFSCGTFCYTIGLFRLMSGKKRNLPVVHTGNLALLPGDETIPVKDWESPFETRIRQVEGFLVEQQSISGLSGAPVFARPHIEIVDVPVGDEKTSVLLPRGNLGLLGVWQGAWDAQPDEVRAVGLPPNVRVPVGIGIVVPTIKIVEILEMPEPKKQRGDVKAKWATASAASLDSAVSSRIEPCQPTNPSHQEDFMALLDAAVRKPQPKR